MLSIENLRKNHCYVFENYGEETRFVVLDFIGTRNYKIQIVDSLEKIDFHSLIQFGISNDYQLHEFNDYQIR